jgi:hypothetical protein
LSKSRAKTSQTPPARPPIRWAGVLFACAANILLVTLMDALVRTLQLNTTFEVLATLAAPLLVGALTTIYVGKRGGIHAFLGGMITIPVLALLTFGGVWAPAILAGAFCGMGGAVTEALTRRRPTRSS